MSARRRGLGDISLPALAILTTIVGVIKEAETLPLRPMTAEMVEVETTAEILETAEETTEETWALNAHAVESALRVKREARAASVGAVTMDQTSTRAITWLP